MMAAKKRRSIALVTPETAIVYRAGGRRYLTKYGAYRALARQRITEACECEGSESDDHGRVTFPGQECRFHGQNYRYGLEVEKRLQRWYKLIDRAVADGLD